MVPLSIHGLFFEYLELGKRLNPHECIPCYHIAITCKSTGKVIIIMLSFYVVFFSFYLLVIQYGFVTIFVAAFPLAPLCAWLNNIIEIRLDAHKFVQVFRRPVAERAQDIGAWFYLLRFVTNLCVITNAFLIAFTSQFIDREVYNYVYDDDTRDAFCDGSDDCNHGFVTWATSPFDMTALLDTVTGNETNFPVYSATRLPQYNNESNEVVSL